MVPWLAFAGCLAMGYGIARRLGAGREGAGLSALVIASLPMAVLEASSTQVDLPLAFWALTLAAFTLEDAAQRAWSDVFLAGAALGLALASKSTAYVICAPLCVWWLVEQARSGGMRRALAETATVGALALLLCLPFYARNLRVFGHPLGPVGTTAEYGNETHGLGTLTSNLVRNSTLHLGTPFGLWNDGLTLAVVRAHEVLGLNPQDPRTTWFEDTRYRVWPMSTYEGRTGNLLHFLLALATGGLLLLTPQPRLSRWYGLAVLAGAVLFCWVLKWQHWHGRLHTPLFILAAPLLAVTLERAMPGRRALGVGLLLWVGSLPWLFASEMRPLLTLPRHLRRAARATVPREPAGPGGSIRAGCRGPCPAGMPRRRSRRDRRHLVSSDHSLRTHAWRAAARPLCVRGEPVPRARAASRHVRAARGRSEARLDARAALLGPAAQLAHAAGGLVVATGASSPVSHALRRIPILRRSYSVR
jgi:4-amino-4-deoxy-L-arabinose transferase-like glycosyltransferase